MVSFLFYILLVGFMKINFNWSHPHNHDNVLKHISLHNSLHCVSFLFIFIFEVDTENTWTNWSFAVHCKYNKHPKYAGTVVMLGC